MNRQLFFDKAILGFWGIYKDLEGRSFLNHSRPCLRGLPALRDEWVTPRAPHQLPAFFPHSFDQPFSGTMPDGLLASLAEFLAKAGESVWGRTGWFLPPCATKIASGACGPFEVAQATHTARAPHHGGFGCDSRR